MVAAAEEDPTVGTEILDPAARELAELVSAVARKLGWSGGRLPLAMAGGFLLRCDRVSARLLGHLGDEGYRVEATAVPEPVRGAVVLACRELPE